MRANDPLEKLLKAAARAEKKNPARFEMPFGWETRVLAMRRSSGDLFGFLPLFRAAFACASVIALVCVSLYFKRTEVPDAYEYSLNYSLASAYLE